MTSSCSRLFRMWRSCWRSWVASTATATIASPTPPCPRSFWKTARLFWGSVPWHYGIVIVLLAHLLGFLMPGMWAAMTAAPAALYTIEIVGFAFGLAALVGLCVLFVRRLTYERIRSVTSPVDWVLLAVLLVQVALGFYVSLVYRWGADWYVDTAVPWLISLVSLNPQTQYVSSLPWVVKLHMLNGFLVIALFPFSRLVHLIMFPFWYLWRPYQLVIRNRAIARRIRGPIEPLLSVAGRLSVARLTDPGREWPLGRERDRQSCGRAGRPRRLLLSDRLRPPSLVHRSSTIAGCISLSLPPSPWVGLHVVIQRVMRGYASEFMRRVEASHS